MSFEKQEPTGVVAENPWARLLRHEDYDLAIDGITIRVKDHVFSPDPELTNSSSMIIKNIPDVSGKSILDAGAGTGVIGLRCAMKGADRVVSTDVSDAALANIKENADRLGVSGTVEIRHSNLFSNVPERFDYIFANLPILDEAWSQERGSTQHLVQRFLDEVSDHLNEAGTAYLAWGSFSDVEPLRAYLKTLNLAVKEAQEEKMGFTWHLFTITKL
jgi:methylase of polypeptide subunit release factors